MNMEELKLVLETINSTTGLAKDFGTTWVWLHYGMKLLNGIGYLLIVAIIVYGIYQVVASISGTDNANEFVKECRDRLGTGFPGPLTTNELSHTRSKVFELIDKHNAEKNK